jgi:hypothetical protein
MRSCATVMSKPMCRLLVRVDQIRHVVDKGNMQLLIAARMNQSFSSDFERLRISLVWESEIKSLLLALL